MASTTSHPSYGIATERARPSRAPGASLCLAATAWLMAASLVAACGDEETGGSGANGTGASAGSGGSAAAGGMGGTQACIDSDGDTYGALECGGDDCDDTNAAIHPGAPDGATKEVVAPHYSTTDRLGFAVGPDDTLHLAQPGLALTYRKLSGGTWTSEVQGDDSNDPSLVLDANGAVHIAYGAFDPSDGKGLRYATNASGSWQAEWIYLSPLEYMEDVSLGMGPDGTLHVAFMMGNDWGNVRYAEKAPSGTWQLSTITDTSSDSGVSLAVAPDGTVHVVYDAYGLRHATKNGGTWSIEEIGLGGSYEPALAVDTDGYAHVAFLGRSTMNVEYEQLYYVTNASGAWAAEPVDPTADGDSTYWYWRPAIAVRDGIVSMAYGSGQPRELRVAAKAPDGWHTAVADTRGDVGYTPALVLDGEGQGHAAYLDLCAGELRHATFVLPDGKDHNCDGAVDAVAIPEPASCTAGDPPQPVTFENTCTVGQGAFSSFVADNRTAPELHLVGVYESATGAASVHLDRATPAVLVLSSYNDVQWTVTTSDDACLQKIIVSGEGRGCVVAPEGVPVEARYGEQWLGTCGYEWPGSGGGCDTAALVTAAEAATGLTLATFAGCYQSTAFTIGR